MKCDKFECCYISDCTIVDYYIMYFGTHNYSYLDFYIYLYFALLLSMIYEMMLKLVFEPAIASSL